AAEFTGPKTLLVRKKGGPEESLAAEKIFINAGCRPAVPKIDGLNKISFLNSTSIMEQESVPDQLLVLGGSYIGLEFGQMFRRFGSRVTIVQSGSQLLGREDVDVAETVLQILRDDGIQILLNSRASKVRKTSAGIELTVDGGGTSQVITGTHLLAAAGRVPN